MIAYKIEENKDGSWGDVRTEAALTTYSADQYKGLAGGDQVNDVIKYLVSVGISNSNLRVVENSR
tara:strand:+ start:819 stop:1013 length:195 start_codon:yes stop_codon:yes gene_type:complete